MNSLPAYIIVSGAGADELQKAVNAAIQRGYEPHGAMAVSENNEHGYSFHRILYQPMVRRRAQTVRRNAGTNMRANRAVTRNRVRSQGPQPRNSA